MKKKLKEAYTLLILVLIISLPIIHLSYVIQLAKEQGEIRKLKKIVNESEELYQNRKIELENKVDLEKIEKEARIKLDMEVSNEIEYFKLK
ncbi:hypothetical protein [uncultured Ilyobacter sp.]|uniref:hypothetical protein n=1 Tax=uncultured Ilyobacter sp. TaxID=544433 RepID=UPI0029C685C3|nr:hypothetical protein [uncultured Ilyobacter sp.]